MSTNDDRIERWAKRILDPTVRNLAPRGTVFYRGDTIYSYGTHFPMAKVLRDERGKARLILLNGDTYSMTTSGHQSAVRSALFEHADDVPRLTIPFSALDEAGVLHDSIVLIGGREAGWTYTRHVGDRPKHARVVVDGEYLHAYRGRYWERTAAPGDIVIDNVERSNCVQLVERDGDQYVWHTGRHWLGDALIAARVSGSRKRVKFYSGFDRNETWRLYFFCQLPPTSAATLDDALEALKPDTVRMAEAMGRTVERQGDIFAVPMPGLSLADLKDRGGQVAKRTDAKRGNIYPVMVSLLGTAHTATEVVTMPDGSQYVRGCMYHDPQLMGEWRGRDHARRKLGDGKAWYMVQRNTVPVAKGSRRRSAA